MLALAGSGKPCSSGALTYCADGEKGNAPMITLYDVDTDDDGALLATSVLPGDRDIAVLFDPGEPTAAPQLSLTTMSETVIGALAVLTADQLHRIEAEVAAALSATAFTGADADSAADQRLRDDLRLTGVVVAADGSVALLFEAPTDYPEAAVYCQLGADLAVEEVSVAAE